MATETDDLLSEAYSGLLADCPWCGADASIEIFTDIEFTPASHRARIACDACGVSGPHSEWLESDRDAVAHAAEQWNAFTGADDTAGEV